MSPLSELSLAELARECYAAMAAETPTGMDYCFACLELTRRGVPRGMRTCTPRELEKGIEDGLSMNLQALCCYTMNGKNLGQQDRTVSFFNRAQDAPPLSVLKPNAIDKFPTTCRCRFFVRSAAEASGY